MNITLADDCVGQNSKMAKLHIKVSENDIKFQAPSSSQIEHKVV